MLPLRIFARLPLTSHSQKEPHPREADAALGCASGKQKKDYFFLPPPAANSSLLRNPSLSLSFLAKASSALAASLAPLRNSSLEILPSPLVSFLAKAAAG